MTEEQKVGLTRLREFGEALRANPEVAEKFRAAFPEAAATLLDGELSDDALEQAGGGSDRFKWSGKFTIDPAT